MAKMKVHELAKELGIQSKDVLTFLQEKGVDVKAPQSSIEDGDVAAVKSHFGGATKVEKKEAPAKEEPAKAEAPKAEAPKAEPVKEAPKAEAPKTEPVKEAPKAAAVPVEAPKTEAPKAEAPKRISLFDKLFGNK